MTILGTSSGARPLMNHDVLLHLDRLSSENALLRYELEWNRRLTSLRDWLAWFSAAGCGAGQHVAWLSRQDRDPIEHPATLLPRVPDSLRNSLPAAGDCLEQAVGETATPTLPLRAEPAWRYQVTVGGATGALAFQRWPVISGDPRADRMLVLRLAAELNFTSPHNPAALPDAELQLVREMLELRALTDLEFRTPQDMLREFLGKLAELVELERATLHLCTETPSSSAARDSGLSAGGEGTTTAQTAGVPLEIAQRWEQWETRFFQLRRCLTITRQYPDATQDDDSDLSAAPPDWLKSVCQIPIQCNGQIQGWLLLSGRQSRNLGAAEKSLLEWAGQFLLTAFRRAEERTQLETRARRDALTGLANRHTFDQEFPRLLEHCHRDAVPCSLLLVDVDHFKKTNDTHGHQAGDQVLRAIAQRVAQAAQGQRVTDRPLVARYGGEEFAVILPNVPAAGAKRIAEDILRSISDQPVNCETADGAIALSVTVSIGIATAEQTPANSRQLFADADRSLYAAKQAGRNRVMLLSHRAQPASSAAALVF